MNLTITSPHQTLSYDGVIDMVANTSDGQQHINTTNGNVNRIKRGKIQLLFKRN